MVRGTTTVCGVFGWPVKHSASPAMHNAAFAALGLDWVYVPFAVAPEQIEAALHGIRAFQLAGVNVTVPLKEQVPPYMDELTVRARRLGAVNTVVHRDGRLLGDSTDGPGFLTALAHDGLTVGPETRAVVLGAGGSARAVVHALLEAGATVTIANRSLERADVLASEIGQGKPVSVISLTAEKIGAALQQDANLLVNTTSMGMYPNIAETPPVPEAALHSRLFVSDLIYNPPETRLLTVARERGCRTQNGIEMLVRQGALAFEQWTQMTAPVNIMRAAVYETLGISTEKNR